MVLGSTRDVRLLQFWKAPSGRTVRRSGSVIEVSVVPANTPDGSVVIGEFDANVTSRMSSPLKPSPNEVTEVGIVNDVI